MDTAAVRGLAILIGAFALLAQMGNISPRFRWWNPVAGSTVRPTRS
jgi:hypothetical protein